MHFTPLWVTILTKGKLNVCTVAVAVVVLVFVAYCNEENLRQLYPSYVNNNISWTHTVFTTILLIDDGIFFFCACAQRAHSNVHCIALI